MNAEQAVANLVRRGAVMATEPGGFPLVVGLVRLIGRNRWFWWQAGVETEFGGHVITGEPKIWHGGLGVEWIDSGRYAYLSPIEEALEEPAEASLAFKAWSEWKAVYDSNERLRAFIEREIKARSEA